MRLTIIAGLLALLISCDDSEDFFKNQNTAPVLELLGANGYSNLVFDSLKLSINPSYDLRYSCIDDQKPPLDIKYNFILGQGSVNNINDSTFSIIPLVGNNVIEFTAMDCYNKQTKSTLNLFTFNNLLPVANIYFSYSDGVLNLDASGSYDMDASFGGEISMYEFTIGKIIIPYTQPILSITTDIKQITLLLVKVKDNDGDWSHEISNFINP